jgi:hypothetical protein
MLTKQDDPGFRASGKWKLRFTSLDPVTRFRCSLGLFRARIDSVPAATAKLRKERKKIAELEIVTEPEAAAEEAGLRYVSDEQPGYTRKRKGNVFEYFDTEGKPRRTNSGRQLSMLIRRSSRRFGLAAKTRLNPFLLVLGQSGDEREIQRRQGSFGAASRV